MQLCRRGQRANALASILESSTMIDSHGEVPQRRQSSNIDTSPNDRGNRSVVRSNIVTSRYPATDGKQIEPQSESRTPHSPSDRRKLPFPGGFPSSGIELSRHVPQRLSTGLFSSSIPLPGGAISDLPDVLRSVLREQNIDFHNDFYWLNRYHAERQRNPEEMDRSLIAFQRERSIYQSPVVSREVSCENDAEVQSPPDSSDGGVFSSNPVQQGSSSSVTSPGFHLSGLRFSESNVRNVLVPSTWSPPPSILRNDNGV